MIRLGDGRNIARCDLCDRLWHACSEARLEHVRLNNELRRAAQLGDAASIEDLAPKCVASKMHRSNAIEAIRAHIAEAHPQAP